jgi:hypothetical protein
MSLKGKTLVKGHTLVFEGAALGQSNRTGPGIGGCSCGERSETLPTTAERKRWHAAHKKAVVAKACPQ